MIPDCQVTPWTPTQHLAWVGHYVAEEKPDVVVNIGDFADMESLSSYDRGKRAAEGRRVALDIEATHRAMDLLMRPIREEVRRTRGRWKPELHLTLGNHEHRIERAIEGSAELDGVLSMDALEYESAGWRVHPFLKPVVLDGVHYAHFFANPLSGRPYGGQSIDTRLKNIGFSFSQGHQQTLMAGQRFLNNGQRIRGLVAGSCYLHDEDYRGPQANGEWRGIIVKNEVFDGSYDLMEVSLDYLCRRYERMHLWQFMERYHPRIFNGSLWLQRARRAA